MTESHTLSASRDFGERVLRLFETLRTPADLAPNHIEAVAGISVRRSAANPQIYGFGKRLDARWICNLVTLPRTDARDEPNRLEVSFDDQTGEYDDLSGVSGLDFDDYSNALDAAGYARQAAMGSRDTFYGYDFTRGPVSIRVRVRAENIENPTHLCVESMIVEIGEVRHA